MRQRASTGAGAGLARAAPRQWETECYLNGFEGVAWHANPKRYFGIPFALEVNLPLTKQGLTTTFSFIELASLPSAQILDWEGLGQCPPIQVPPRNWRAVGLGLGCVYRPVDYDPPLTQRGHCMTAYPILSIDDCPLQVLSPPPLCKKQNHVHIFHPRSAEGKKIVNAVQWSCSPTLIFF